MNPTMESSTVSNDRPHVRVPKLAVRNRSDNSITSSEEVSSATSTISVASRSSVLLDRQISEESVRTTRTSQPAAKVEKSTKKGGVFGFLSLKEPSTSAWEDYAKQQKQQQQQLATGKRGSPTPVGLAGLSKQKLPDHVPKVNSKWDGLPENTKRDAPRLSQGSRRRQSDQARRSLNEGRSLDSQETSRTKRVLIVAPQDSKQGSLKSTSASILDGIEVVPQAEVQAAATAFSTTQPVRTQASAPPEPEIAVPRTRDRRQSPLLIASPMPPELALELDSTELPQLTSLDLHTSPETSPQTPPADRRAHRDTNNTYDEPSTFWLSDTDAAIQAISSTPSKLPIDPHTPVSSPTKSLVMNFSRPSRPLMATSRPSLSSPTTRDLAVSPSFPQAVHPVVQLSTEPVELPCPSTLPPSPSPPPPAKAPATFRPAQDVLKRGRFSVMLGLR
nr:hypothetical protein CFP56_10160 [Quercus suber]